MIYAIRAVGTEFVKIGRATNVGKRLAELETGCPHELSIVAIAEWPDGAETLIHKLLRANKAKNEWFSDCELLEKIIGWMGNRDAGLARLHHEATKAGYGHWDQKKNVEPTVEQRINSVISKRPMTKAEKRRSERIAWWQRRVQNNGQTHPKAATSGGNTAEDQG